LSQGGRVLSMGNGGGACHAEQVALEFMQPTLSERTSLPALIGNDADFSLAFMRQIKVLARPGDIALGISVGGKSPNGATLREVLSSIQVRRSDDGHAVAREVIAQPSCTAARGNRAPTAARTAA
jgi:phosphoheptose isomerase